MAFNFATTIESMDTAHDDIDATYADLNTALNNLQNDLDAAIGGWVGPASTAYHALQVRWNEDQRKMNTALHNLARTLKQARDYYVKTENAATDSVTPKG